MKPRINLTTQRFGRLLVISQHDERGQSGDLLWRCLCDCGQYTLKTSNQLTSGRHISCGCSKHDPDGQRINMSGKRFGMLIAIEPSHTKGKVLFWKCLCDCGKSYIGRGGHLRYGSVTSCGCQEGHPTHRLSKTHAYRAIVHAIIRCEQPDHPSFPRYGKRGIKVCKRWHDVEKFCEDMGQPATGLTLDRINNNGHYSCGKCQECLERGWPMNCRWTDRETQCRNKSSNRYLTANEKTMLVVEWVAETRIPKNTILNRLNRGWSEQRALTTPSRTSRQSNQSNAS